MRNFGHAKLSSFMAYASISHPLLLFHISYTVELDDLIEELSQHIQPQQTWQERQELSNESWERIRPIIFEEELVKLALRPDDVSVHTYLFICVQLLIFHVLLY